MASIFDFIANTGSTSGSLEIKQLYLEEAGNTEFYHIDSFFHQARNTGQRP